MKRRRSMESLYDEMNARYFDGRLPPTRRAGLYGGDLRAVVVRRVGLRNGMRGLRAGDRRACDGVFTPPAPPFHPARINVLALGEEGERRTLLHEMIHCGIYFGGVKGERHGPRFVAELRRLASLGETWAAGEADRYAAAQGAA